MAFNEPGDEEPGMRSEPEEHWAEGGAEEPEKKDKKTNTGKNGNPSGKNAPEGILNQTEMLKYCRIPMRDERLWNGRPSKVAIGGSGINNFQKGSPGLLNKRQKQTQS